MKRIMKLCLVAFLLCTNVMGLEIKWTLQTEVDEGLTKLVRLEKWDFSRNNRLDDQFSVLMFASGSIVKIVSITEAGPLKMYASFFGVVQKQVLARVGGDMGENDRRIVTSLILIQRHHKLPLTTMTELSNKLGVSKEVYDSLYPEQLKLISKYVNFFFMAFPKGENDEELGFLIRLLHQLGFEKEDSKEKNQHVSKL